MTQIVLEETNDTSGNGLKSLLRGRNGALMSSGAIDQAVPDYPDAASLLASYNNFSEVTTGDVVTITKTSNGQTITALVGSPLVTGESRITLDSPVKMPCSLELEASAVRARHQFATVTLYSNSADGPDDTPDPVNITSIYQSSADAGVAYNAVAGTILTIVLETALPKYPQPGAVYLSDWIHVDGLTDNRLNYPNLAIKFISADRKTITCGFSDEAALPSLAVPAITPGAGTAKIYFYNNMGGAHDGFGFRLTNTTATSAALVSVFGNGDAQVSGTLIGDHRTTIGTTAPVYSVGVNGEYEIRASTRFRLESRPTECAWLSRTSDTNNGWTTHLTRTAVKPSQNADLRARFRLVRPRNMTRPVAKITSISKAGSTTWTVNHDGSYPFATGNYVTIKGNRDVTNFAPITTPVAITVVSPTQFTLLGTTGTATGYGGSVILANGGVDQPGIIGQTIQSITVDANGWVTFVGNTTWAGMSIGDYIETHGIADNTTGAALTYDGCWEVASLATTSLVVKPVYDVTGSRVSPDATTLGTTNCSGTVILRTTLRSHDLVLDQWTESRVMLDGAGTTRADKAHPVNVLTMPTVTATVANATMAGTAAVDAAMPNPVAIGGRASNANITAMSATGDLVAQLMTMIGAAVNKPFSLPEADWQYAATIVNNTSTAMQAAGGAGIKKYLTGFVYQNTNATATVLNVLRGSTVICSVSAPATMTAPVALTFPTPLQTAANEALNVQCVTTGANVLVNAQGYTAP